MKWYNIFLKDGRDVLIVEPPPSPQKGRVEPPTNNPVYYATTFRFTVSDNCKLDQAIIYDRRNGHQIYDFGEPYLTAGEQYLQWNGVTDSGNSWYYPQAPLQLYLRFESLYDDTSYTTFSQNFDQGYYSKSNYLLRAQQKQALTMGKFAVFANYPNPFNSTTHIEYRLPQKGKVELAIYNILGQKVRTLVHTSQEAGEHAAVWKGRNQAGNEVGSGVYFYKLTYEFSNRKKEKINKILLLK